MNYDKIIVIDPKGELYSTLEQLKRNGYVVKKVDLTNKNSFSTWNPSK